MSTGGLPKVSMKKERRKKESKIAVGGKVHTKYYIGARMRARANEARRWQKRSHDFRPSREPLPKKD